MSDNCECGVEVTGIRTTRWGSVRICGKCKYSKEFPQEGSFVPVEKIDNEEETSE